MAISESQARTNLQALIKKFNDLSADDRKVMSEASVVRQFIDILLRDVLGWPIEDPVRYRYEQVTQVGRPDMMLTPEAGGTIFVEAKRFGIIKELEQARKSVTGIVTPGQLALPGMAVDRTPEEQQAINYAFANNGTWAILCNFEKLRLFNARRDWLVLSFETPGAYLSEFDILWQLSYENVLTGSLDRLSNQRLTAEIDADYLKFINEWREKLAQDVIERMNQNTWAFAPDGQLNLPILREVVQRIIDRLVIIRFAEDHLVIPPGSLRALYEAGKQSYLLDVNLTLKGMFRRFDETHNSALFADGVADKAVFGGETLIALMSKLYDARYRSMPADIMGNTYEQYLGKTLVRRNGSIGTADNLETRKKQGSYYTPQVIVRYIVDNSLGRYLYGTDNGQPDGPPLPGESRKTSADIRSLRVLDSACGSGSFLIYAYEALNNFYRAERARLEAKRQRRLDELMAGGVTDSFDLQVQLAPYTAELERISDPAHLILETHLYGVDLDLQAAEIAVVNLMMRALEGQSYSGQWRLPLILGQNVKTGNALVGLRAEDMTQSEWIRPRAVLRKLRAELLTTPPGEAHDGILRRLKLISDSLNAEMNAALADHFTDLTAVHPFHWGAKFPEVFFDAEGEPLPNPGFTIIFGNPPWEILKPDLREFYAQFDPDIESRLTRTKAETRIAELDAEDPNRREAFTVSVKSVEQTAAYVRASGNYQRQGRGDVATHKLFLERMYGLLQHEGRLGYVVPSGIYTDLGTKELREMLLNEGNIQYIFSFSNERFFFNGVHHAFKFTMIGAQKGPQTDGFWSAFRFNPRVAIAPDDLPSFLSDQTKLIYVRRESLAKFSPDSLSVMEFQSRRDYEIAEKIYGNWPLLGETRDDLWSVKFVSEFHITNDRELFNTAGHGLPLYEGKLIHQFDAFYGKPQFWLDETQASQRLANKYGVGVTSLDYLKPRLAFRGIAAATNERTLIAAILPPSVFSEGRTATTVIQKNITEQDQLFLAGCLNSFILDWILRLKVAANINMFYMYQLPVPRLNPGNAYFDAIVPRAARLTCTRPEFAELWQSVMGEAWDISKGATDPAERQKLRNEIDAIVAHLYGLSRADFDHILGTFPLVFPDTDAGHAKRAVLLETVERMGV
ncbi:MAG: Eco57I restriction-modification methylase domain-containing protein [Aggregatilineales bacterium]